MLLAGAASAQPVKVGIINMAKLEQESTISVRATELLKKEFEPRRLQMVEAQKRATAAQERLKADQGKLSAAELRNRERDAVDLARKAEQAQVRFAEELEVRKRELRVKFVEEANAAVKTVAEAGKFDLIVHKAAFARPAIDVTPLVLKEMARRNTALR
jgi:Skp family chaperone for outer membrane proteins